MNFLCFAQICYFSESSACEPLFQERKEPIGFSSSMLKNDNQDMREAEHWKVSYLECPSFKHLKHKCDILDAVSYLLKDSLVDPFHRESVCVKIYNFSENDYNVVLDYTYRAYNAERQSFEDDQASRTRMVESKEEIVEAVRDFIAKYSIVTKLQNKTAKNLLKLTQDESSQERREESPLLTSDSPVRKKSKPELKQLTLKESVSRK